MMNVHCTLCSKPNRIAGATILWTPRTSEGKEMPEQYWCAWCGKQFSPERYEDGRLTQRLGTGTPEGKP